MVYHFGFLGMLSIYTSVFILFMIAYAGIKITFLSKELPRYFVHSIGAHKHVHLHLLMVNNNLVRCHFNYLLLFIII